MWFREIFFRLIPAERPILLLIDSHKVHVTNDVIEEAVANNILVFCLPAHASHLLQPLDLSLFGPLKKGWITACAAFHHLTSVVVSQRNFSKIFNTAWHSSNTPEVIRAGFRRSGIFPFNPQAFDYNKLAPSEPSTNATESAPTAPPVTLPVPPPVTLPVPPPGLSFLLLGPSTASPLHSMPAVAWSTVAMAPSPSTFEQLISLEEQMEQQGHERYWRRLENGFDVVSDEAYNMWKSLVLSLGGPEVDGMCPCNSACHCTCHDLGFCDCFGCGVSPFTTSANGGSVNSTASAVHLLDPYLSPLSDSPPSAGQFQDLLPVSPITSATAISVDSLPSATRVSVESLPSADPYVSPPTPSSTCVTPSSACRAPDPYLISTPSGDVHIDEDLCSIMLKPAINIRGTGRKRNRSLDPGNKCIQVRSS